MIDVEHPRENYGDLVVVSDVSFTAASGRIFGLLGPNGAGKSTTISCISGLVQPTAGRVRVLGHDVVSEADGRRRIAEEDADRAAHAASLADCRMPS